MEEQKNNSEEKETLTKPSEKTLEAVQQICLLMAIMGGFFMATKPTKVPEAIAFRLFLSIGGLIGWWIIQAKKKR
jgi:prepilin signal peptidase PulO-like enzyme (type II secretory pathway)